MSKASRLTIVLYAVITATALVLLKLGTHGGILSVEANAIIFHVTPLAALGVLCYGISFALYTMLISRFDLSFIVPVTTALVYVITFTASFAIFHEAFSVPKIAGIALILCGLILLNLPTTTKESKNHD